MHLLFPGGNGSPAGGNGYSGGGGGGGNLQSNEGCNGGSDGKPGECSDGGFGTGDNVTSFSFKEKYQFKVNQMKQP